MQSNHPHLIEHLFRQMSGNMTAAITHTFGIQNLNLAEDASQNALLKALRLWPYSGVPVNPEAWLMKVAMNEAITLLRKSGAEAKYFQKNFIPPKELHFEEA